MWKIYPLDLGRSKFDKSDATLRKNAGQIVDGVFLGWYLTDGIKKIVVDCGLPDLETSMKYHPYTNPTITKDQLMVNQLSALGVDIDDIELVLLTHLHWDHAGSCGVFAGKKARFIVSSVELANAVNPCPAHWAAYDAPQKGITPGWMKVLPQIDTIEMADQEILPGISMFPTPGHSVGSMSVAVETSDGTYVISGDAVACYENLIGEPAKGLKYIPNGVYHDLGAMWNSFDVIMKKACGKINHVFPGHEMSILDHRVYPIEG